MADVDPKDPAPEPAPSAAQDGEKKEEAEIPEKHEYACAMLAIGTEIDSFTLGFSTLLPSESTPSSMMNADGARVSMT